MKRIEDYTDEELLNLTEEQTLDLIDLECGYEGVKLLPKLPDPPNKSDIEEDLEVFEVPSMMLATHDDAAKLIAFASTLSHIKTQYVSGPSIKQYGYIDSVNLSITTGKIFSKEYFREIDVRLAQHEAANEAYQKAKNEYDGISRERETIINKVNDAIKSARHNLERLTTLKKASLRFLTLAHGDKEIAKRFMLDAYKANADAIEEHFEAWTIQHVTDKMAE